MCTHCENRFAVLTDENVHSDVDSDCNNSIIEVKPPGSFEWKSVRLPFVF